jgi:GT2 family glycosyltransferase
MLTVALVHFETPDLAASCVASVRRFPPSEPYEVVIVDNASSTEARATLDGMDGARIVDSGRNGGFAYGVNCCFDAASPGSDVVIVMNPDTEVRNGRTLDELALEARRPSTALAAPALFNAAGKLERSFHRRFPQPWMVPLLVSAPVGIAADRLARAVGRHPFELSDQQLRVGTRPGHVMGAVMAIPRLAWEAVGPFDDGYFLYLEETEWQDRAGQEGLIVRAALGSEVTHLHRGGAIEGAVPSRAYLASLERYLVSAGARPRVVRLLINVSLMSSVVAFAGLRVATTIYRPRRAFAEACLAAAVRELRDYRRAASGR